MFRHKNQQNDKERTNITYNDENIPHDLLRKIAQSIVQLHDGIKLYRQDQNPVTPI